MTIFALILLAAGVYHFVNPAFYDPIMPEWFPKRLANAAGGIVELIIGVLLLMPKTKALGIWMALALMVFFLPLHIWDITKARPAIGNHWMAAVRLLIQFALIGWLYWRATRA